MRIPSKWVVLFSLGHFPPSPLFRTQRPANMIHFSTTRYNHCLSPIHGIGAARLLIGYDSPVGGLRLLVDCRMLFFMMLGGFWSSSLHLSLNVFRPIQLFFSVFSSFSTSPICGVYCLELFARFGRMHSFALIFLLVFVARSPGFFFLQSNCKDLSSLSTHRAPDEALFYTVSQTPPRDQP